MRSDLGDYSQGIYIAKGIGIILVVVGHYIPELPEYRIPHYWLWLHDLVYTFHMPLFMFLSGFLYAAAKPLDSFSQYVSLIRSKAKRLLIPFLSVAAIILFLKSLGGLFFKLQHPISVDAVENILLNPMESFAPIIWFLYVLFEVFLLFGLCFLFINNELYILTIALILFLIPSPEIFMIRTLLFYFPIFIIGFICYKHDLLNKNKYSLGIISFIVFTILIIFKDFSYDLDIIRRIYHLIAGVLGSLSCFFLAIQASKGEYKLVQALKYVGIYSMGIYLFHTPFMGPIRIFLLQVIKLSDYWFFPTALIVVNIGLIIPIFLEKYVIRRQPILARSLLGIKA